MDTTLRQILSQFFQQMVTIEEQKAEIARLRQPVTEETVARSGLPVLEADPPPAPSPDAPVQPEPDATAP